jgi:putative ABC transport system permease protein
MRPDDRELDDEIRGHLALSIQAHLDRGEDPATARQNALAELGYVGDVRESMRRVWYSRWFDAAAGLARDVRIACRSLLRAKGLAAAVVVTLGLGIGANAAIFSVVRGVLLRPLVNRDEDRLVYIRQAGMDADNVTFSVPEVKDFEARATTISAFGEFSTVDLTVIGLGPEPRLVKAGVVGGSFFDVMGLRPVLGRLLTAADEGPNAAGAAVLTNRFWTTALNHDTGVVGRTIRIGDRAATIVGVLEPAVPYPADTQIIANMVTSPHHLQATMQTNRTHRMTELFGRIAPGASIEDARAELTALHGAMMREHPEAYPSRESMQVRVNRLRDQISSPARTILLILLAAAAIVFVIACSNVANLILARSVRRQGELAIRAALGAGRGALRRTLLAESLVLCGAGAALGLLVADPFVAIVARFAARFSVRALDVSVDPSMLWVGVGLAITAAILLAFVPRLPSTGRAAGLGLTSGSVRLTPATNRRLRVFATVQIAFSFVLLAGAGMLMKTLVHLETARTAIDLPHVLVFDIPPAALGAGRGERSVLSFYEETTRRVRQLPGVDAVAVGCFVPWRDAGSFGAGLPYRSEGQTSAAGEEIAIARMRIVAPNFFATLGMPILQGRDFNANDRAGTALVAVISESVARRAFPGGTAINRRLVWKDPIANDDVPARVVGVVPDLDDEHVVAGAAPAIYLAVPQIGLALRLFVHASGDPTVLVPEITRTIRHLSADQAVARPATLEQVRSEVLSPERLNAFVVSGFAGIALLIAVVGVSGVLAFTVSTRAREFGVRLAVGSAPRQLLMRIVSEGVAIAGIGIAAGAAGGLVVARAASWFVDHVQTPDALPVVGAAAVLMGAAVLASLLPAARAASVDVIQALRAE